MKLSKKITATVVVLFVLLLAYVAGVLFYSERYLPGTHINDTLFAGKEASEAYQTLTSTFRGTISLLGANGEQNELPITEDDYLDTLSKEDFNAVLNDQNNILWFTSFFRPQHHRLGTEPAFDGEKIKAKIQALPMLQAENMTPPQDAHIFETDEAFIIVPEVQGTTLKTEQVKDLLFRTVLETDPKTLEAGVAIDLLAQDCYVFPVVFSDDPVLTQPLGALNALGKLKVVFTFENSQEVLDLEVFKTWVTYSPETGIEVDNVAARAYVDAMALKYDTLGKVRQFETTDRGTISIGGGIYGWRIDPILTTKNLIKTLKAGESRTAPPDYDVYGNYRNGSDDIGKTYIEIDITRQTMWYYVDGEVFVETGIVSGLKGSDRETPTGVYKVWIKEKKRYLTGEDYKLWVEYWMQIDWFGVGIHDASWQPSFGGTAWTWRGSHGCINTPYEFTKKIFDRVTLNTPVIIYKS